MPLNPPEQRSRRDPTHCLHLSTLPLQLTFRESPLLGQALPAGGLTPVQVMDPEVQGKCATGFLWVYGRPGGDVLFDFRSGRSRAGPDEMLQDFGGRIQSDAFNVYPSLVRHNPPISRMGRMAHVRQKFHDALGDYG